MFSEQEAIPDADDSGLQNLHTLILSASDTGTACESCSRIDYAEAETSEEGECLKLYLLEGRKACQKLRKGTLKRTTGSCK